MSKPSPPPPVRRLPAWVVPLTASAGAWAILFSALSPAAQDFPLNDDWAFARSVFAFARGEGIHYGGWASMPQLGQWLWACPFVWLLGASHVALRLAVIVLSWFGLWAFYDLLRQEGAAPRTAAFATAVLAFNPLFFLLQGTFMTDVPALALALGALALYVRGMRTGGGWLALACLVATLAAITRQTTLTVPATAAVLLWRRPDQRRRLRDWLALLVPVAVGLAVHVWFQGRSDVRALQPAPVPPGTLLALPFLMVHFCGLSALPLLLLSPRPGSWRAFAAAFVLLLACAGYWLAYGLFRPYGGLAPYTENMLTPWGAFAGSRFTGPFVVGDRPPLLGTPLRSALSVLGCLGGAALLARIVPQWRAAAWARPLVMFTLLQVPFLLVVPDLYDRYFLSLLPGALALAAPPGEPFQLTRRWGLAGLGAVALLAVVSVGLMHDWLSWNAARWALGRRALAHHVKPLDIEGGVEWDGWYAPLDAPPPPPLSPPNLGGDKGGGPKWPVLPFTREWFPSIRGRYALSFSELRGSRRVDAEPYRLWLAPGERQFFLLEVPPLPAEAVPSRGRSAP